MVCRFPSASDCDAFWRNLIDGKECSRRLPRQELLDAGVDEATIDSPDFVNVSAPLDGADLFDAAIFGYSRQEAETLDPQQRVFLQSVWHVLEHAGYAPKHVPHKTGVFGSARMSTYTSRQRIQTSEIARARGMQALLGNDKDYLATRAAYKLNLTGPALTVQTACSSSLVAVHLACESLRSGECSMAVAGGVGISFPQHTGYRHQPGMIFSSDGSCRPFDAEADGTFGGNGVGVVALRRLEDALADGDPILAVIRGSAVNNDGDQKVGFTAPSASGQRQVILEAMTIADVSSSDIGMIEAHGTATSLGDPIEFAALRSVFEDRPSSIGRCAIGSVKASIGHLDTAAGIASLIKAVLAVQCGTIPPAVNFSRPNPLLEIEKSCFYAPSRAERWSQPVRTAGVSSFGIGGTNCHAIVQSLPTSLSLSNNLHGDTPLTGALLLSAGSEASLRRTAGEYAKAWKTSNPQDLAHTALVGRRLDLPYRLCTALSEETPASLRAFADGSTDPLLHYGTPSSSGKMAWLFTGVGSQWAGMGQELYGKSDAFATAIERCNDACNGRLLAPLTEIMFGGHTSLLDQIDHALPVIVAYEIAMAAHWRSLGLRPDVVIGHSLGEYAAAAVAGLYTDEQMMALAIEGSRLLYGCEDGAMLAAVGDESTLSVLAEEHGVEVAVLNGPRHLVFSGAKGNITSFGKVLREARIRTRALPVSCAAHSSLVEPILETYRAYTNAVRATIGQTVMISSFHAEAVDTETLNSTDFWCNHLRRPVRYREAIQRVLAEGVGICLELGPDANLTDIGERDAKASVHWIPVARRSQPESSTLQQTAVRMFAAGIDLPWKQLLDTPGRRVHAPLYSFDEQRFWLEPDTVALSKVLPPTLDHGIIEGGRVAASAASMLDLKHLQDFAETITTLHNIYVDKLVQSCVGDTIVQGVDSLDILRGGRILPRYRQLLVRLLNACVADGYYERTDDRYRRVRSIPHSQLPALIEGLRNNSEGLDVIPEIVAKAGEHLYEILTGRVEPLTILFPAGRSEGVEVIYRDFSTG
ncbi:MAG TPA: type I polyketide synthase, partial [Edaphobacter sp.]|nr:type I polyketide synthase [Edaphobacter sp.]